MVIRHWVMEPKTDKCAMVRQGWSLMASADL